MVMGEKKGSPFFKYNTMDQVIMIQGSQIATLNMEDPNPTIGNKRKSREGRRTGPAPSARCTQQI
jgi:hypothetical protein